MSSWSHNFLCFFPILIPENIIWLIRFCVVEMASISERKYRAGDRSRFPQLLSEIIGAALSSHLPVKPSTVSELFEFKKRGRLPMVVYGEIMIRSAALSVYVSMIAPWTYSLKSRPTGYIVVSVRESLTTSGKASANCTGWIFFNLRFF